ncbi:MAG TPA: DUF6084 family protein [Candidatus Methylacidiphilales bacterium]|nr:DUF6084 family protein [Candidatus Methylacidiphilales bacterium]
MPDLGFQVTGLDPAARGLAPLLGFQVGISNTPADEPIHAILLQAQIQLQVTQRRYTAAEKEKLSELFGPPEQWRDTLRAKLWTLASANVPAFTGSTTATLTVPCTFDLNVAPAKYFYGLDDGDVPLLFLFSGTVFYEAPDGRLQVQQISWKSECTWKMPVRAWHDLMEHHYPGIAWLALSRENFERLYAYRRARHLATWDRTLEQLLPEYANSEVPV